MNTPALPTHISPLDLAKVRELRGRADLLLAQAHAAAKDAECAQLRMLIQYGIGTGSYNLETGEIMWPAPTPVPAAPEESKVPIA